LHRDRARRKTSPSARYGDALVVNTVRTDMSPADFRPYAVRQSALVRSSQSCSMRSASRCSLCT
jgi:hypothetical protein